MMMWMTDFVVQGHKYSVDLNMTRQPKHKHTHTFTIQYTVKQMHQCCVEKHRLKAIAAYEHIHSIHSLIMKVHTNCLMWTKKWKKFSPHWKTSHIEVWNMNENIQRKTQAPERRGEERRGEERRGEERRGEERRGDDWLIDWIINL